MSEDKTLKRLLDFIEDIDKVCKKHNLSISHEDIHGAFIIQNYDKKNIDWLRNSIENYAEDFYEERIKVVKVKPLENYIVEILYSDGTIKHYDISDELDHPLFKRLRDKTLFNQVRTDGYCISWGEDIDVCAESIYSDDEIT